MEDGKCFFIKAQKRKGPAKPIIYEKEKNKYHKNA